MINKPYMRLKFRNLSHLPKAKRWSCVSDRYQTPGLVEPLFTNSSPANVLDPSHPATKLRLSSFPRTTTKAILETLGANIYPIALLSRPQEKFPSMPFLTWNERLRSAHQAGFVGVRTRAGVELCLKDADGNPQPYHGQIQVYPPDDHHTLQIPARNAIPNGRFLGFALHRAQRRVHMSFSIATSKKRMGPLAYIRAKIVKRLRGALDLIGSRGAYVSETNTEILLNEEDAGRHWSMQGWTYMFFPTTKIYRMPLPDLINLVRDVLQDLNRQAIRMENMWLAQSLLNYRPEQRSDRHLLRSTPTVTVIPDKVVPIPPREDVPRTLRPPPKKTSRSREQEGHETWKQELEAGLEILSKRLTNPNKKPRKQRKQRIDSAGRVI